MFNHYNCSSAKMHFSLISFLEGFGKITSTKTLLVIRKSIRRVENTKMKTRNPFSLHSELVLALISSTAFYINDQIQIL